MRTKLVYSNLLRILQGMVLEVEILRDMNMSVHVVKEK